MKDRLSALLDGELDDESGRALLDSVGRDRALRAEWDTYCLIGDALRGERLDASDLVSRVMREIEAEPTVLAPVRVDTRRHASNGPWRTLLPLAASLMGVAAVGWVAHTLYAEPEVAGGIEHVATSERVPATPVRSTAAPAGEDPHREYVFAHQAMTGGGPIPGGVQYVRTVSVVGQDTGR